MKIITDAKEFKEIIFDLEGFKLKDEESEKITGYLEGHDYFIKTDEKKLFIVDVSDETDIFETNLKEIVERVIEWNGELVEDKEKEFIELLDYILEPQKDLIKLKKLFAYLLDLKIDFLELNNLEVALNSK